MSLPCEHRELFVCVTSVRYGHRESLVCATLISISNVCPLFRSHIFFMNIVNRWVILLQSLFPTFVHRYESHRFVLNIVNLWFV